MDGWMMCDSSFGGQGCGHSAMVGRWSLCLAALWSLHLEIQRNKWMQNGTLTAEMNARAIKNQRKH
jgi:hypothetical protein